MMAQDRHVVEEAYAGDIIGVFDPGIFSIGDTVNVHREKNSKYEGNPNVRTGTLLQEYVCLTA